HSVLVRPKGEKETYTKSPRTSARGLCHQHSIKRTLFISIRPPSPSDQTRSRVKILGMQATARVAEWVTTGQPIARPCGRLRPLAWRGFRGRTIPAGRESALCDASPDWR